MHFDCRRVSTPEISGWFYRWGFTILFLGLRVSIGHDTRGPTSTNRASGK